MNSFLTGPPREDSSLSELMSYLRPKSNGTITSEVQKALRAQYPREPDRPSSIIDELGMNSQEFAELALNTPEMWDSEQLHYLEAVSNGLTDEGRLVDLAEDYLTMLPKLIEPPKMVEDEPEYVEETRLPLMIAQPALTPINDEEPIPVVGESNDDWWKKK